MISRVLRVAFPEISSQVHRVDVHVHDGFIVLVTCVVILV